MRLALRRVAVVSAISFACAAAATLGSACKNHDYYGSAYVSDQAGDPLAIIDPNAGIWLNEGSAASAHIDLKGFDGTSYQGNLVSMDPSVLQILHTPSDPGTYVFLATYNSAQPAPGQKNDGTAEVVISVNGVEVRSIVATVLGPSLDDGGASAEDAASDEGPEAGDGGTASAGEAGDASDVDGSEAAATDAGDGGDAT